MSIKGSEEWAVNVIRIVSKVTGVTMAAILGRTKAPRACRARIACAQIMIEDGGMKNTETGEAIGQRHAASISYYRCHKFGKLAIREILEPARRLMEDGA